MKDLFEILFDLLIPNLGPTLLFGTVLLVLILGGM